MSYHYSYGMESTEGFVAMVIFYLIYMVFTCGFAIAMYVLRSLGTYTIAKRRGLKNAWFAWFPVVDAWLLGCISDQYQYVVKGKDRSKRKWLVSLSAVVTAMAVAFIGITIGLMVNVLQMEMAGMSDSRIEMAVMESALGLVGLSGLMMIFAIWMAVLRYLAMYDLYRSCDPRNSTMYLVLSIVFNVTEPFFIFFNRQKDEGMPPRRDTRPAQVEAPAWEAPQGE